MRTPPPVTGDLAPERAKRDERREPLGALHVEPVEPVEVALVGPGRQDLHRLDTLGVALQRRQPRLGDRGAMDADVEVVDAGAVRLACRGLAGHLHDRICRMRAVGQQHVLVGRASRPGTRPSRPRARAPTTMSRMSRARERSRGHCRTVVAGSVSRWSPWQRLAEPQRSTGSASSTSRHPYEHRVKGAAYAASALGIEPARLAKTLVVAIDGDPVFVLVPGDRELSLKALARLAKASQRRARRAARRRAADRLPRRRHQPVRRAPGAARVRRARLPGARARRVERWSARPDHRARARRPAARALPDGRRADGGLTCTNRSTRLESPRYSGPRTFARLPALAVTEGVDVAIFGMPWDSGTSFRPGARFGPEGVRSASALLRPYNPAQDVQVFGGVSCVDYGDAPTVPGYIEDTLERIAGYVTTIHRGRCDRARDRRRSLGDARRAPSRRGRARTARAASTSTRTTTCGTRTSDAR